VKMDKYYKMAETMERTAEDKLRPRETNTPKKLGQARSAEREGQHLLRAAKLIRSYIDAVADDNLPESLKKYKSITKDCFLNATKMKHKEVANRFHSYHVDTTEYCYDDGIHKELRELIVITPEDAAKTEQQQQQEIELRRAIDNFRNSNIPGFFPTPPLVLEKINALIDDLAYDVDVLEPSAGLGDIADYIQGQMKDCSIDVCEIRQDLQGILRLKGHNVIGDDFLRQPHLLKKYGLIVMNPPFEKNAGVKHVLHAMKFLAHDGRLIAVLPPNQAEDVTLTLAVNKADFRHYTVELPKNSFNTKDAFRKTSVSVCLLVIDNEEEYIPHKEDDEDMEPVAQVKQSTATPGGVHPIQPILKDSLDSDDSKELN